MVLGTYVISDAIVTWITDPTKLFVKNYHEKADGIVPFPAVVICPRQEWHQLNKAAVALNR